MNGPPPPHLTQATPDDHPALAALAGVIFQHLGDYQQVLADWLATPGAVAWMVRDATRADPLLGAIVIGFYQEDDRSVVDIVALMVVPEARGRGLATALLGAALAFIDRVGGVIGVDRVRLTVEADNASAQRLYQRAGFAVVTQDASYPAGQAAWRMERPVPAMPPAR